ncbi:aldo/keto reductase [Streptomyces paromomycinus]|uniref:aldo/keto reductase n=1 Tax=Streptomyces paromomycinus TaxID=92743 RepID=UPI000F623F80|nr:aldo/keto reductase [Streptomyces paromomycinus]
MRYIRLGTTGLEVSAITLGCMSFGEPGRGGEPWSLGADASRDIVKQVLVRGRLTRARGTATARAGTDEGGRILYRDGDQAVVERVQEIAGKRGLSPAQVALAWVMRNPAVTSPIVGVTKPAQPADAVAAVDVELDADEAAYLEAPYQPHAAVYLEESFYKSRPVAGSR